jgi:tetraacyldisaccharide 4'-kinase
MGRVLNAMSMLYGTAAGWRRDWYDRQPTRRRQLDRPVVSVGNLSVGGSGKTPLVRVLAELLLVHGERPSVLSRGYGRLHAPPGVTVVSDGREILAGVELAGDEPLMLARALPRVPVLVGSDRYASGRFAEQRLGATVHLLDDGFQHVQLSRDIDLLVTSARDLDDRPMPAGRLREFVAAARRADAALVETDTLETLMRVKDRLRVGTVFRVSRTIGRPQGTRRGTTVRVPDEAPVFAVAAVARPERFFSDLRHAGWRVAGTLAFGDHHRFSAGDLARIGAAARSAQAAFVVTTEKDAVRLEAETIDNLAVAAVPLILAIEPGQQFDEWLRDGIARARARRSATRAEPPASGGPDAARGVSAAEPLIRSEPPGQ